MNIIDQLKDSYISQNKELFEITNRALADNIPRMVDLAFLHSQTKHNDASTLMKGFEIYGNLSPKIGITWADSSVYDKWISKYEGANPNVAKKLREKGRPGIDGCIHGYPGHKNWENRLIKMGITKESIVKIEPDYNVYFSTLGESRGLVKYCKKNGIKKVSVTSAPFHQTRTLISGVSALIDYDATDIKLYSIPGKSLPWTEDVVHSQGSTKGSVREILINEELPRIIEYQIGGDVPLRPLGEIIEYLNQRD